MSGLEMNEMGVHSYCREESSFSEILYDFKTRKTKDNIQNTYKNDKVCNQIWPDRPRVMVCHLCHGVWGHLGTSTDSQEPVGPGQGWRDVILSHSITVCSEVEVEAEVKASCLHFSMYLKFLYGKQNLSEGKFEAYQILLNIQIGQDAAWPQ